jgi:hypothetical protein
VGQERADHRRVEIGEIEQEWLFAGFLFNEPQQQPERVAVGLDRFRAGVALVDEAIGEERLSGRPDRRSYPNPQAMWILCPRLADVSGSRGAWFA